MNYMTLSRVVAVLALVSAARSQTYPSSVVVPNNSMSDVMMSCVGLSPIQWRVNGTNLNVGSPPPGIIFGINNLGNNMLSNVVTVLKSHVLSYNGSSFQCSTNGDNFSSVPTAHLIVFGIVTSNRCQ